MSIGLDGAFCADRGSSPVDMSPALRVPSNEVPSARQHFLEMIDPRGPTEQSPKKRFLRDSSNFIMLPFTIAHS